MKCIKSNNHNSKFQKMIGGLKMTTRVNRSVTVSKICNSLDAGISPRGCGKLNIIKSAFVDSFLIKLFNPTGGSF